ncbi:MAG: SdrD B-like domain-containing protein, partial [Cyanobacteriota bacterium]
SVNSPKLVFIEEGFIVQNDIFVPENLASDLLDVKTNFSESTYAFDLGTNRVLKALVEINETANDTSSFVYEEPSQSINESVAENKTFKLKKLSYNIGSSMNSTSGNNTYSRATAKAGFIANGNLLGGEYNIGADAYYSPEGLSIGGYRASLDYVKPKYELSIGATNARLSDLAVQGSNLWGLRVGTVGSNGSGSGVPRLVEGKADDNCFVELFINGVYADRGSVKNGLFQFDSIKYSSEKMVHIVVEQIAEDGTRTKVYDRKFSQDADLLAPGQHQFMVFSGVDASAISQQLFLFGDRFDRRYVQPVKFVSGAKFRTGVSEDLTVGINVAKDIILRQPTKLLFNKLSSARVFRTGRSSSGSIVSIDLDYVPSNNLRISSELGYSMASSKIDPAFDPHGNDFGGYLGFDYNKNNYALNGKVFSYGPDFYSPGSSSNLMDKRGFELGARGKLGPVSLSGMVTNYDSNLDNYFEGGKAQIFDYNLYASGQIDKYSSLRAGVRSMGAQNALYYDRDTTFDITIDRQISDKTNLVLNYAKTIRKYSRGADSDIKTSSNNRLNAQITYDAGKIGVVRLAHEMMSLDPVDRLIFAEIDESYLAEPVYSKNIRLTLDRSNLPVKGFTLSPNIGYRYGGQNKGVNFGLNLGYIFKSGRRIALNYAYNSSFGRYMAGALSFGGSKSHTLSFNLTETLGFGASKGYNQNNMFKSSFDNTDGIVKGTVYIDLNHNGIKDPDEEGVPGIDVNFQNFFTVTTDNNGEYIANIKKGLRKVGVQKETLPVIYTPTVADALVNVKPQKVYVANLGLEVTPGSISGNVNINKDNVSPRDVVIILLNKDDKEVKYTTTDSTGSYYIDSIAPGDYTIKIDPNYLDYKGLQATVTSGHKINVPLVTDDFIDIENINFNLIPKKGEVTTF